MTYQVLARKWRPKSFATLVGQEHVVQALSNALSNQRLHHAYLLTGTRGVGKTTIARILAKSLNCETGVTATPCGLCAACQQIDAGRFVDLLEIDAASNTGIDNIREVLDNAQYAPTIGRFKVYIIDEVHMLSKSAFNAMLKTLEEPPGHVKFILATTDPQKVPVTILSRCLQFSLRNMTPQRVAEHLDKVLQAEQIRYEAAALPLLGHAAAGSMRDALSLLDQAIAYGAGVVTEAGVRAMLGAVDQSYLYELLRHLAAQNGQALVSESRQLLAKGLSFDSALQELALALSKIALAQTVPDAIGDEELHKQPISELAEQLHPDDVQLYYQIALHGRRDIAMAPDEETGFQMTLLRMLAFAPGAHENQRPVRLPAAAPGSAPARQLQPAPEKTQPAAAQADNGKQHAEQTAQTIPPTAIPQSPVVDSQTPRTSPSSSNAVQLTPQAPSAPLSNSAQPLAALFDGNWQNLVSHLKTGGLEGMLANNSTLIRLEKNRFELSVAEKHKLLTGKEYQDRLRQVLSTHFGQTVELSVVVGDIVGDTPAALAHRERLQRQVEAERTVNDDPVVQAILIEFSGTIINDSIKPI